METYTVHRVADVWHAGAGYAVLDRHRARSNTSLVIDAVAATFRTVRDYDAAKLERALAST